MEREVGESSRIGWGREEIIQIERKNEKMGIEKEALEQYE